MKILPFDTFTFYTFFYAKSTTCSEFDNRCDKTYSEFDNVSGCETSKGLPNWEPLVFTVTILRGA